MSGHERAADLPTVDAASFRDESALPYAFCPGCSHGLILDQLDAAFAAAGLDPSNTVLVTDIGCAGISDRYFRTHAFHGLHGRSVTYATGIKVARPELDVVVLIGDGGCGIGGHHLLNAARRNVGITVVVFNNFNFGMTGGQYSVTTPPNSLTATTPHGHLERPLDIAGTVAVNGAGFAARATAYDPELPDILRRALVHNGFSLVDIWELCVAYYVPRNNLNRGALERLMTDLDMSAGVIRECEQPEYSAAYRAAFDIERGKPHLSAQVLPVTHSSALDRPLGIVIAGSAGQRVLSAGGLLATAATMSGLWATRRDDYPITVRAGHSLAEVKLSPEPITYTGAPVPDVAIVLAPEGEARLRPALRAMSPDGRVFAAEGTTLDTRAQVLPLSFHGAARSHVRRSLATLAVGYTVDALGLFPLEALREAAAATQRDEVSSQSIAALDSLVRG